MPKDTRKCQMYIARVTYRAAQRAAQRVKWIKLRNKERYEQNQTPRRFQGMPTALIGGVLTAPGNPFGEAASSGSRAGVWRNGCTSAVRR